MVKSSPPAKEGWLRAKRADGVVCVRIRLRRIYINHPTLRVPLLGRRGVFVRFCVASQATRVLFEQPLIHELPLRDSTIL